MRTTSPAAFTRATVVIAVKYSIVERPEKIDEIIYPEISSFLMLIKDHDRVSQIQKYVLFGVLITFSTKSYFSIWCAACQACSCFSIKYICS